MTSYRDRRRAAARARLERDMAVRAESARRRKRIKTIISGSAALVVVVGAVVVVTMLAMDDGDGAASAAASPESCVYQPVADPSAASPEPLPDGIQQVGAPDESSVVRSGVQLMTLNTSQGTLRIQVETGKAPCTAASFTHLAGQQFFDETICHRLTTEGIYVIQCGDPSGSGMGGPDYRIRDENLPVDKVPTYPEGTVAMANAGANTNGSQFFIVYQDSELPASYTVFGHVLQGLDIIKRVASTGVEPTDPSNPGDGAPKAEVKIASMIIDPAAPSLPDLPPASPLPAMSTPSVAPSETASPAS